ncbi:unnamed protein product [Rotaria sordida]|uniref:DUF7164 domain-containing protein n=1 Tax=Rotaria sordida TaxID=392033 RepID=A0A814XKW1_9BILA|nr:unnamed protein product [Rotaria sordida]CAF1216779.1 unnamed protein product [Rotaria sordida]
MIRRRRRNFFIFLLILILLYIFIHYPYSTYSRSHLNLFDEIHSEDNLYVTPKYCFTKTEKKNIRRAIIVHFPIERSSVYISELKWLYLSWIETIQNQPSDWQTNLVIYSLPSSLLDELGCYEYNNKLLKNNCIRINYNSLWNKTKNNNELLRLIQIHVPKWCRHLDSLGILLENSNFLNQYDYILRTDIDVFLTPHFAHYIPFDCSFQIGLGGYSLDYTLHKLSRIAQTLNLLDANLTHVGSTWYGPPQQIALVGRLALWLSVWLCQNEFTLVEKDQRLSILSWPQWYIGVISMYASHLAINHYAGRGQIKLIQKPYLIDYSCTTNTSFNEVEIIHIHAWHTNQMFSKFLFKNGSYDEILSKKTQWNTSYSLDFILRIAWQSNQMATKELYHLKSQI